MPFPDPADAFEGTQIPNKPGLGEKDRAILDAMIENGFIVPEMMWFNQPVGNLDPTVQAVVPLNLRTWFALTYSKRPDIIMVEQGVHFVVEVKPYASYKAFGQVLMYQHHLTVKADPARPFTPLILTDIPDQDLVPLAAQFGVEIRQLGRFLEDRPTFQT